MPKTVRIKATPQADKNIQVKLEQDFDLLEILSLKISKSDVYTRMCAEYGVIVGRALANSGFGIPNAKISVFIPLTKEDEEDPIISQLYPYKQVNDKNEEGYRYNLLPKTSEGCNHKATGSFFTAEEAINNPIVVEVFEKYYKYTTKTNKSGDFMLWGIPLGVQTVHASIDVSDIGCYSMRPYQFIKQGVSPAKFESSLKFKTSSNLDTLPQIIIQNKVVDVVPFWGDDELCNVGITRTDFDLRDSGVEIIPSATFIGSIMTDEASSYVSVGGVVNRNQGNLCSMTTGAGTIEAVRHTILKEEDNCTPKLEYFTLESGGKVIDGNGAWVIQVPMNLEFVVTNEYGEEVISDDPTRGIPTEGKYRFRISFDGNSGENRKGSYLVPNIREYTVDSDPNTLYTSPVGHILSSPSYTFSDTLWDYPLDSNSSWENSPAYKCEDYFYHFEPNKVYTVTNFIDNYRKTFTPSHPENSRWNFLAVKTINPPPESRCTDITKEFPPNDAFRGGTMLFTAQQLNKTIQLVTILITGLLSIYSLAVGMMDFGNNFQTLATLMTGISVVPSSAPVIYGISVGAQAILCAAVGALYFAMWFLLLNSFFFVRRLYNYPSCEPCSCGPSWFLRVLNLPGAPKAEVQETQGEDTESVGDCNGNPYMLGFQDNADYWRGAGSITYPRGCYVLAWPTGVYISLGIMAGLVAASGFIPIFGPAAVGFITFGAATTQTIAMIAALAFMTISMNQWRVLSDIYFGLCQGVFNMKFSNNWINGILYHFRFMRKSRKVDDAGNAITNPIDLYPDRVVWRQVENESTHFYYRSCPFSLTSGFSVINPPIDNNTNRWPLNSQFDTDGLPHCGINFPTTISDLGPLDPCITELCSETGIVDPNECFFIDKLKASSFQPTDELLGRIIQQKVSIQDWIQFKHAGINKWFGPAYESLSMAAYAITKLQGSVTTNRRLGSAGTREGTNRPIDGDIAQLIATNNMLPISVYTTDVNDPYYGEGSVNDVWDNLYGPTSGAVGATHTSFPLLTNNNALLNCVIGGSFGIDHTQVIPYYIWDKESLAYGTLDADYRFGSQDLGCAGVHVATMGYQQGTQTNIPQPTAPEGTNTGDWSTPSFYGLNANLFPLGQFTSSPLAQPVGQPSMRLGTNLFYYFGLRQGATSYDKFINEYLPPTENE